MALNWVAKFKGDQDKINWVIRMNEKGKLHANIPKLDSWELMILNFYSICVSKENGVVLTDLKVLFDNFGIVDSDLFYRVAIMLNRIYHQTRSIDNARN